MVLKIRSRKSLPKWHGSLLRELKWRHRKQAPRDHARRADQAFCSFLLSSFLIQSGDFNFDSFSVSFMFSE
jgi:hypothetical protein